MEETFQSKDIDVLFSRSLEPWRKIRGIDIALIYVYFGPQCPLVWILERFYWFAYFLNTCIWYIYLLLHRWYLFDSYFILGFQCLILLDICMSRFAHKAILQYFRYVRVYLYTLYLSLYFLVQFELRLQTERMVRGLWLHRPKELPTRRNYD